MTSHSDPATWKNKLALIITQAPHVLDFLSGSFSPGVVLTLDPPELYFSQFPHISPSSSL